MQYFLRYIEVNNIKFYFKFWSVNLLQRCDLNKINLNKLNLDESCN